MALFRDRAQAGRELGAALRSHSFRADPLVLGLARGGVPVAYEVARALDAPLDVFLVRKLGVPGQEELAFGAIASGDVQVLNRDVIRLAGLNEPAIGQVIVDESRELERRERVYRGDHARQPIGGRSAILVDDGLATGASMLAAVQAVKAQEPAEIVVGVPTAAPEVCAQFEEFVDDIICVHTPAPFYGVGMWYRDFSQVTDDEVRELLDRANEFA